MNRVAGACYLLLDELSKYLFEYHYYTNDTNKYKM